MNSLPPEDDVLYRVLSEPLTAELSAEVDAWLKQDPDHAERLAEFLLLENMLITARQESSAASVLSLLLEMEQAAEPIRLSEAEEDLELPSQPTAEDAKPLRLGEMLSIAGYLAGTALRTKAGTIIAIAAAMILGVCLTLVLIGPGQDAPQPGTTSNAPLPPLPTYESPTPIVATLTAEHGAVWERRPGQDLFADQRLTLTQGLAEITTARGAVAILESPATIELLDNDNALYLHTGKLVGICETESSHGFLVRTPHMDITDLGTRFGVEVIHDLSSEVHVRQGEVVVAPSGQAGSDPIAKRRVVANQAVRMNALSNALAQIEPAFDKFEESPATRRLFSTGFALAEGELDPNWQIVADGKGLLDQPIPLKVRYGKDKASHYPAKDNDPTRAQWLIYAPQIPLYNEPTRPDLDNALITVRSEFQISDTVPLEGKVLYLKYATPELGELRINGKAVEPLPKAGNRHRLANVYHEAQISIESTAIKPGENVIEIDLPKPEIRTAAPLSFYLYSEIRPTSSRPRPSKGETAP